MGIPFVTMANYGTVATIGGKKPGKCVLLRADMDALAVQEENDVEYASTKPGIMHACGHDSHSAMLLGCAKILKDMEDEINGTVRLCFQLSEENGQGAKLMIKEGLLDGVDACFALHVCCLLYTSTRVAAFLSWRTRQAGMARRRMKKKQSRQ